MLKSISPNSAMRPPLFLSSLFRLIFFPKSIYDIHSKICRINISYVRIWIFDMSDSIKLQWASTHGVWVVCCSPLWHFSTWSGERVRERGWAAAHEHLVPESVNFFHEWNNCHTYIYTTIHEPCHIKAKSVIRYCCWCFFESWWPFFCTFVSVQLLYFVPECKA